MPRQRQFDIEDVMHRAMLTFWEHGYDGTSVQDLVDAAGVNRFSLYAAFGDKHGLFTAALDRYRDHVVSSALGVLEASDASLPALAAYLDGLARAVAAGGPARFGCLMANTMADLTLSTNPCNSDRDQVRDEQVLTRVTAHLDRLLVAFTAALTRAEVRGELRPGLDPGAQARQLAVLVQGISSCARVDQSPDLLRDAVSATMTTLTPPNRKERP